MLFHLRLHKMEDLLRSEFLCHSHISSAQATVYGNNTGRSRNNFLGIYFSSILKEVEHRAPGYELICQNFLENLTLLLMRQTDSAFELIAAALSVILIPIIRMTLPLILLQKWPI